MPPKAADAVAKLPVSVTRTTPAPALQPFTDYFQGFERVGAVRKVFGDETEEVLARLKIGFISNRRMYMGIRDRDGNVSVGTYHLRHSPTTVLYLDIVHELFHIKQWMRDKEWFTREHEKFMGKPKLYYSSPLEVPAYSHTVREAERLGMTRGEITKYLEMMPVSSAVWGRFIRAMRINPHPHRPAGRLPVRINREPKLALLPFTDYFHGFERTEGVRVLFEGEARSVLEELKVEFLETRLGSIFPSEEDGHLVVNTTYFGDADLASIYLDVVLSLNVLKRSRPGRGAPWDSPQVVGAYRAMVSEARRIGVPDTKVIEGLHLPRFMMAGSAYKSFVRSIGLGPQQKLRRRPPAARLAGSP